MLAGHECLCCGAPRFGQGVAARGAANIAVATGGNAPPCLKTPFAQSRWKTFTQSHHACSMLVDDLDDHNAHHCPMQKRGLQRAERGIAARMFPPSSLVHPQPYGSYKCWCNRPCARTTAGNQDFMRQPELVQDKNRHHAVEGFPIQKSALWKANDPTHRYYECKLLHVELSTLPDIMFLRKSRHVGSKIRESPSPEIKKEADLGLVDFWQHVVLGHQGYVHYVVVVVRPPAGYQASYLHSIYHLSSQSKAESPQPRYRSSMTSHD
eukprot:1151350-Pelagomonas_calceolata.AAC.6